MRTHALRLGEAYAPTLSSPDAARQMHPAGHESIWTRPAITDLDAFRRVAEQNLADAILSRAEGIEANPRMTEVHELFRWEINGMCLLLRELGGYGSQSFDVEWARAVVARNTP